METSTPATTPPVSAAVPLMVILAPSPTVAPPAGEVIVEVGAVVSVDAVAAVSPEISAYGCTPMSANRFTVACCMLRSGVPPALSSPHDHCTVPAPNTSAPLGARYSDRWWVAVLPALAWCCRSR